MASTKKVAKNDNPGTFESLSEVFRCFICMEKLHDARLCPHCSKLCCYTCIRKWITETRSQCPHCRASLHIYELINCRWVDDVTKQLESLQQSQSASSRSNNGRIENGDPTTSSDKCEAHGERLSVFCSTCNNVICPQCALFDDKHEIHNFRPLDEVYHERVLQIETEMNLAMERHLELISLSQEVEKNVEMVKQAREERVRELRSAIELMITRLDSQLKSKLVTLTDQRNQLSQEIETLGTLLTSIKVKIGTKSHAEVVAHSSEYLKAIIETNYRSLTAFVSSPVPADFVSEIVPPYESSTFTLHNYSTLRQRADPVFSQPLHIGRLSWRIKVYPDGNGVGRGNYLSVFIELTTARIEPSKYEYRIEMVHQASRDPSRSVVREFTSHFEGGECWGYNRFFRLDLLASEGYLDVETDVLVINFQVRAPTYFQKCRDQQWHIAHLEATREHCLSQLAELKQRLDLQMTQQTTEPNTSENAAVRDKSVPHDFAASSVVAGQNVAVTASAGDDESRIISDTAIPANAPNQAGEGNFTSRSANEVPLGRASELTGPHLPGWCSMLNFPLNGSEQGTESDAIASSRTTHEDDRSTGFVNSPLEPSSADVVEEESDSEQGTDPNFQSSEVTAQPTSFSYPPQPTAEPVLGLLVSSNTQNLTRSILSSVDLSPFTASYDSEDQGIIGLLAFQEAADNNQMYETIEDGAEHRDSEEERSNLEEPVTHSEHSVDAALPGLVEQPVEFSEGDDDGYDANQQTGGSTMHSHHSMEQQHTDEDDYQSSQHQADDTDEYESLSAEDSPRTRSEPNLRKPLNQTAASTSATTTAAFPLALNTSSSFEKPFDFDCENESSVDEAADDHCAASCPVNSVQCPHASLNPETILPAYQAADDGQDCSGNFSLIEDMLCLPAPRNTTPSRHQPHHCNGNQKRDAFRRRSDRSGSRLFRFRFTPKPRGSGVAAGVRSNLRLFNNGPANRSRHSNSSAFDRSRTAVCESVFASSINSSEQECHPDTSNWHWNHAMSTSQAVNEQGNLNYGSDHVTPASSSNSAFRSLVHTTRFPGLSTQNGITDQNDDFLLVQGACAGIHQTDDLLTGEDCNAVPVSLANRLFFRRLKRLSKETRLLKQSIQNLENDVDNETGIGDRDVSEHAEMVHSRRPTSANVATCGNLITDEHISSKPRSAVLSSRTMVKAKATTTSPQMAVSSNLLGSSTCECRFSDTPRVSRGPSASGHSRRPSVRGDNGSSKGEIQNRTRLENLSANTPSRSEQRLHELSEHISVPCTTPTSLTKPEDQVISFQSSNYTPENQNTSLHGRLSSMAQVVTEEADVSLAMLCHRISRLQTEAEAVARAITSSDPSQSTTIAPLNSDQFSRSMIEDKSEKSGPNPQGDILSGSSTNSVAVALANRESQSNGVSPRDRDARNQSVAQDQIL
ncbi:Tripartite motif containing 37 [Clonorchis sinensis]|uniref:Tripartite motif containing 37 n=1 Tax=Clonorchis sinensis TaxID=79923 RepID=A0A8T1M7K3_CLOSI|nr:Tripartite motif containing 37 [Clonorchis sinensis]